MNCILLIIRVLNIINLKTKIMKTKTTNQKFNLGEVMFVLIVIMMTLSNGVNAQQQDSTQALFRSSVKVIALDT
jgi:hypothetical protein